MEIDLQTTRSRPDANSGVRRGVSEWVLGGVFHLLLSRPAASSSTASRSVTGGASYCGSRWCRSLVDGHPVVTGERAEEGRVDRKRVDCKREERTRGGNRRT